MIVGRGTTLYWGLFIGLFFLTTGAVATDDDGPNAFSVGSLFDSLPQQTPDLVWSPEPFSAVSDSKARYIDYEAGDDDNPGSRTLPWKHHPWDRNARGGAASAKGVKTYIFKQGVSYRGSLLARESGEPENPIRLTIEPDWGSGVAVLSGAFPLEGGWKICLPKEASILPEKSRTITWCQKLTDTEAPRLLWEVRSDGGIARIPIARMPNWQITNPYDPRSEWLELKKSVVLLDVEFDKANLFMVGDDIWQVMKKGLLWKDDKASVKQPYRVVNVQGKVARIEIQETRSTRFSEGIYLTNGEYTGKVVGFTKPDKTLRRLVISPDLDIETDEGLKGADIWVERAHIPVPLMAPISAFDPVNHSITANLGAGVGGGPTTYSRYYLEGAAGLLDSPGEYYYRESGHRDGILYLRLPEDRDPNTSTIEVATELVILNITDQSHIDVSGLTFRYSNQVKAGSLQARRAVLHASAIQVRGSASYINIHHCQFDNLAAGIIAYPLEKHKVDSLDNLHISDNTFLDIDGTAIALGNARDHYKMKYAGSRLSHLHVLRNKLQQTGLRPLGSWGMGSKGHGITINGGEVIEVAGNHVNFVGGSGISVFSGSGYEYGSVKRPFLRTLIHHNKVVNSVLLAQDYGGIASWMGGPAYIYNNISGNSVGYIHSRSIARQSNSFREGSYGVGVYLDGQYKGYVFNNIVWGLNNNLEDRYYNAAGLNEAMGFMNTIFHNTFFRFSVGIHKGMFQHNRCYYLGNLMIDMGLRNIQQEPIVDVIDYTTLAFKNNVFSGEPQEFGQLGRGRGQIFKKIHDWVSALRSKEALEYETGWSVTEPVVRNKEMLDMRPVENSVVIDRGVKVFVPWALSRVVGEWHFLRSLSNPAIIQGENINMNQEWIERSMYQDIPRNNLVCNGITADDYALGTLENWTHGALRLDGNHSTCKLSTSEIGSNYAWHSAQTKKEGVVDGKVRDTVDIANENFLIEVVLAVKRDHTGGGIVAKQNETGYALEVDDFGKARLVIKTHGQSCERTSTITINDGGWHHLLVEVDRKAKEGINLYIDGKASSGNWSCVWPLSGSLSNSADFVVGKSNGDEFYGQIDFLRIAKGTLKDAETTIEELYDWEFNGPFLKDFSGNAVSGVARDVGAVEYLH